MARLRLIASAEPVDPVLDAALGHALLERVADGQLPDVLRISRPGPAVVFGKRDAIAGGYDAAVREARAGGFQAVERLAGGRAAVFHEQTISIVHIASDEDPRAGITRRFEDAAALTVRSLARLGLDAQVGEVPGEYCPGAYSVSVGGAQKVMGVGQRIVRTAAHVGMVVVVAGEDRINRVLDPVYAALGLGWRPAATGSLARQAQAGISWEAAAAAFEAEYSARHELEAGELDEQTLARARELVPEHSSP